MNKKVFLGGVITGVVSSVVAIGGINFTVNAAAFKGGKMSMNDKMKYISSLIDQYYVDDYYANNLEEGVYKGLVSGLNDPYSTYFTKEEMESFMQSTNGSFYGIGVTIQQNKENGRILIVGINEESPAQKAGMKVGDEIYKVNGQDITTMEFESAVELIRGEKGTTVDLTVKRDGKDVEMNVERAEIDVDSVASKVLDGNIGYIYISGFKNNTYDQFKKQYDDLMAKNVKGLIIDVRDNPGGVLGIVEKIADMLIPEGNVVYTIDKNGNRQDYKSDANCINIPLAVLVNGNSASASEILAGAVQDSKTGVLVGTQTFGKGCVQNLYKIPDGSGVKITIQKYYTPNGVCIQGTGITPDYIVDDNTDYANVLLIPQGEDAQLDKAIEVINEKTAE